ncbi:hypothetical protein CVB88_23930, partial [Salmonella enterica subsp. enterica serovar Enteritidis]
MCIRAGGGTAPTAATGLGATVAGTASLVLWEALERVYADLGFDALGDEAFKQLVLARIIEPTSNSSPSARPPSPRTCGPRAAARRVSQHGPGTASYT